MANFKVYVSIGNSFVDAEIDTTDWFDDEEWQEMTEEQQHSWIVDHGGRELTQLHSSQIDQQYFDWDNFDWEEI